MRKSDIITIIRDMQAGLRDTLPATYQDTPAMRLLQQRYDALDTVCSILDALQGENMRILVKQITELNASKHAY